VGILSSLINSKLDLPDPAETTTPKQATEPVSTALEDLSQIQSIRQDGIPADQKVQLYPTPIQVLNTENGTQFTILLNQFAFPKSQISIQQLLASASAEDTIRIVISNVGGFIYSTLAVASMITSCKAKTIGVFSVVDSIEALIVWLACKEKQAVEMPYLVLEGIRYGNPGGAVTDQFVDSKNTLIMQADLLSEVVASGILTQDEATTLSKKESVFTLFGDTLKERIAAVISKQQQ